MNFALSYASLSLWKMSSDYFPKTLGRVVSNVEDEVGERKSVMLLRRDSMLVLRFVIVRVFLASMQITFLDVILVLRGLMTYTLWEVTDASREHSSGMTDLEF